MHSPSDTCTLHTCFIASSVHIRSSSFSVNIILLTVTAKLFIRTFHFNSHHFCTTKLSWFLLINDVTLTLVPELQAFALRFLKVLGRFAPLCKQCSLFVGERNRFGLCIRNFEKLWKQQQHIRLKIICKRQGEICPCSLVSDDAPKLVESNTDPPSLIQHTNPEQEQRLNNNSQLDGRSTAISKILTSAPSSITSVTSGSRTMA